MMADLHCLLLVLLRDLQPRASTLHVAVDLWPLASLEYGGISQCAATGRRRCARDQWAVTTADQVASAAAAEARCEALEQALVKVKVEGVIDTTAEQVAQCKKQVGSTADGTDAGAEQ